MKEQKGLKVCKACGASFINSKALVMHVGSAHPDILDDALAQHAKKAQAGSQEPTSELAKGITGLVTTADHLVQALLLDIAKLRDAIDKMKGEKK